MIDQLLTTNRLILRPITDADFDAFFETLIQDPVVMRVWHEYDAPMPLDERRTKAFTQFFGNIHRSRDEHGYITWMLALCDHPDTLIGTCGILNPHLTDPTIGPQIGYMISSAHYGKGLMPEAARAVLADAFERYPIDILHALIDEDNPASRRVAEKLGFTFRGTVLEPLAWEGKMVYYTLTRSEHDASR